MIEALFVGEMQLTCQIDHNVYWSLSIHFRGLQVKSALFIYPNITDHNQGALRSALCTVTPSVL